MENYIVEPSSVGVFRVLFRGKPRDERDDHVSFGVLLNKRIAETFAKKLNGTNGGKYTSIWRCDNQGRESWDAVAYGEGGYVVHSNCKTSEAAVKRIIRLNNGQSKLLMAFHHGCYRLKNWIVDSYYAVGEFLFGDDFYSWCRCCICGKFMTSKDEGVDDPVTGKWCCAKHWQQEEVE